MFIRNNTFPQPNLRKANQSFKSNEGKEKLDTTTQSQKNEIQQLRTQNKDLIVKNMDLKDQLTAANARIDDLEGLLASAYNEIGDLTNQ